MTNEARATLEDLTKAKAALERAEERDADYTGGNPDKYHTSLNDARRLVYELTWALKAQGDLPMTEHEQLCARIDQLAPNASSGQIVEFDGATYRRRFIPLLKSRSGKTVQLWDKTWEKQS
ncbi:MAG: hypothetical protein AB7T59_17035 [Hyphomonadaceae bacterium]